MHSFSVALIVDRSERSAARAGGGEEEVEEEEETEEKPLREGESSGEPVSFSSALLFVEYLALFLYF